MEVFENYHFDGLLLGLVTFLTIGLFHPIVIKSEYYFGVKCWWWFLLAGIGFSIWSMMVESIFCGATLGVVAFSCFWSILEIFEQRERVRKGWFPKNPKRKD
ncbi:MAG: DUF4491 family protein [Bacteroidales bacterium]|nr:DUF4491 family protein [Bacteroidales bacterium]